MKSPDGLKAPEHRPCRPNSSRRPYNLPQLPAFTALRVATAKPRGTPDGVQGHFDLGDVGQHGRAAQTSVADHLPMAGVEKIYDLIFDCHWPVGFASPQRAATTAESLVSRI